MEEYTPSASRTCSYCGSPVEEGHKFCSVCGAPLAAPEQAIPEPPAAPVLVRCPVCGAELNPEQKFCTSCGAPIGTAAAIQTGTQAGNGTAAQTGGYAGGKKGFTGGDNGKTRKILLIAGIAVILALLAIAVYLFVGGRSEDNSGYDEGYDFYQREEKEREETEEAPAEVRPGEEPAEVPVETPAAAPAADEESFSTAGLPETDAQIVGEWIMYEWWDMENDDQVEVAEEEGYALRIYADHSLDLILDEVISADWEYSATDDDGDECYIIPDEEDVFFYYSHEWDEIWFYSGNVCLSYVRG